MSIYKLRMNNCYPQVIRKIKEFNAIIGAEYPEFDNLSIAKDRITEDAYLLTMGEERIAEWEQILSIKPLEGSTIEDRRDVILARIRGQGKLNTELINTIVKTFTGGTAISYITDSTLFVEITPPPENKQYKFANVENEIKMKLPAHLNFQISRNYATWADISDAHIDWQNVSDEHDLWEDVLFCIHAKNMYATWHKINNNYSSWNRVQNDLDTWNDVLTFVRKE